MRTSFRTRKPRIDIANLLALLFGYPFQDGQEFPESQIPNFATPKSLHPFQVQRLEVQHIKAICQLMRQFPEPVTPTIRNILMPTGQILASAFPIGRAFQLTAQVAASFSNCIQRLLEELGRFNLGTIFKPKSNPADLPVSNLIKSSSTWSTTTTMNSSPKVVRLMVTVLTVPSIARLFQY